MVNDGPMLVVVNSQSPIGSFKDLIAAAKAKPGALDLRLSRAPAR